jgi:serine/threonine protein kinase
MQSLGKYVDLEQIGQGPWCKVYRGYHPDLGVYRALKVFERPPKGEDQTGQGASRQADLLQSNIIRMIDCGHTGGVFYQVMEYQGGGTLRKELLKGPMPASRALELARQMAQSMKLLHQKGRFQLNLRPEKVLLDQDQIQLGGGSAEGSAAGAECANPAYQAPEQLAGNPQAASNQWALGAVLFEMLSGEPCFKGKNPADITSAVKRGPIGLTQRLIKAGVAVTPSLLELLHKLMAPKPADRYVSVQAAYLAISALCRNDSQKAGAEQPSRRPINYCQRCGAPAPTDQDLCADCVPSGGLASLWSQKNRQASLKDEEWGGGGGRILAKLVAPVLALLLALGAFYAWFTWTSGNAMEPVSSMPVPKLQAQPAKTALKF